MTRELGIFGLFRKERRSIRTEEELNPALLEMIEAQQERYKSFYIREPIADMQEASKAAWEMAREVAERGRELGSQLDSLSVNEKRLYIEMFSQDTGFPNSQDTSAKIIANTLAGVHQAAEVNDADVAYAGYSTSCSVGRGLALPGSDVDGLSILIRSQGVDVDKFINALTAATDPRLTFVGAGVSVFTEDQLQEFANYLRAHGNKQNLDELYELGWPEGRVNSVVDLLTAVRKQPGLIDTRNDTEREEYKDVWDSDREITWARHGTSDKNIRQQLLDNFPQLSVDEQFVVIRMLQISSEAIALDPSIDGPHTKTLKSLQRRGFLEEKDGNLRVPWAPYPWLFRNLHLDFYPSNRK